MEEETAGGESRGGLEGDSESIGVNQGKRLAQAIARAKEVVRRERGVSEREERRQPKKGLA